MGGNAGRKARTSAADIAAFAADGYAGAERWARADAASTDIRITPPLTEAEAAEVNAWLAGRLARSVKTLQRPAGR